MVLSNKKLKQKLRAQLAESLALSVAKPDSNNNDSANPDPKSQPKSLKQLLGSEIRKPRLSKREKRRETLPFSEEKKDAEEKENGSENLVEMKKKKRKRDEQKIEKNGMVENGEEEKKLKKKNKKKKKKKKSENEKNEERKEDVEVGKEEGVKKSNKNFECQASGDISTQVYVGGIPYYSTEDDIRSFFESCGTITGIDCMKFPDTGKFRGIAILSFKTEAAANRALAMDGADMGGLFLKVQPYKATRTNKAASDFSPNVVEGYNRIYLGNLSWDVTEDDIRNLFSDCSISSIRFGMDKETSEFRGYAHVHFTESVSLAIALKLDQTIVCGRPVKIRCAVPMKGLNTHSKSASTEDKVLDPIEKATDNGLSSVSGKIRRRTCYECGEKGHISSDCPKQKAASSVAS